jgi:hypothetical protein
MERFCWITAQGDRTEHAVSDHAQAAARQGIYEGLCGGRFLAAPMIVEPAGRCSSCRAYLRARAQARSIHERMREPRPRWLDWLCPMRGRHPA